MPSDTEQIINGMAKAFWVDAWARDMEEKGASFAGQELMSIAPKTPPSAYREARKILQLIESNNGERPIQKTWGEVLAMGLSGRDDDPELFGHYLAMECMGHGVAWTDDGDPDHGLTLPCVDALTCGPGDVVVM